jgi:hypothetical protein
MIFRQWFRKKTLIRLSSDNGGFISTERLGKIRLNAEVIRMRGSVAGVQSRQIAQTDSMIPRGVSPVDPIE